MNISAGKKKFVLVYQNFSDGGNCGFFFDSAVESSRNKLPQRVSNLIVSIFAVCFSNGSDTCNTAKLFYNLWCEHRTITKAILLTILFGRFYPSFSRFLRSGSAPFQSQKLGCFLWEISQQVYHSGPVVIQPLIYSN